MKDAVATMGGILPDDTFGRDAVHVAVFSAHSGVKLYPGQDVSIVHRGERDTEVGPVGSFAGIVDPFLKAAVPPGERFWCYLYPRTITALAHRWSHPAFETGEIAKQALQVASEDPTRIYVTPTMKLESERWLRDECENNFRMPSYERLMEAVLRYDPHEGDEYLTIFDTDASGEIPATMWGHLENILGRRIPGTKPLYFSCSC